VTFDDNGPDDAAEERLRAVVRSIGDHARTVNRTRADRLSQVLADVAAGSREESARHEATEIAHQLVGSAGTFGFAGASQLAGEIERYFVDADFDDPDRLAAARDQVRRLQEELTADPDYQPDDDERDPTS
jgi:HPt (histidine-containing phosphotransfer) domain-containing protein